MKYKGFIELHDSASINGIRGITIDLGSDFGIDADVSSTIEANMITFEIEANTGWELRGKVEKIKHYLEEEWKNLIQDFELYDGVLSIDTGTRSETVILDTVSGEEKQIL